MTDESQPADTDRNAGGVRIGDVKGGISQAIIAGRDVRDVAVHFHQLEEAYAVRGLPNPYLGLRAFTYDESDRYAGRERTVEEAVKLLTTPGEQRALFFITGASGSGKSSFAQAGLLPALETY
jgi:hypothetical protein